jgi:hypothetical protein
MEGLTFAAEEGLLYIYTRKYLYSRIFYLEKRKKKKKEKKERKESEVFRTLGGEVYPPYQDPIPPV